ncbi:MAG: AAA family ATPase [Gammaproteobacteria bacterium]|nr:AAA family ATPase [Gammaproteobacteria bacterium]
MIKITNIGPIATASIPVPEDGGVVVLRGRNGSGKSIALEAVNAAVSGKGKPPLKDLAKKGEVQACGATLTVGRTVRRAGELEVSTLEGRLSVADLVDPGLIDSVRADATRIKALVGLSGAVVEPGDLHGFPEELIEGIDLADPVAAMAELKRRIDIGAKEYEKLSAKDKAAADAIIESLAGDLDTSIDPTEAQERVTTALRAMDALEKKVELAEAAKVRILAAMGRMAELPAVDLDKALQEAARLEDDTAQKKTIALELKAKYEAALADYKTSVADRDTAIAHAEDVQAQAKLRAELERQIQESHVEPPSPDALSAATAELATAKFAQSLSAQHQVMAQQRNQADALITSAQEHAQEATALRRKAKQTDEVLSEIVSTLPGCPLQVTDGRLLTATKRGPTFYAELSMGERWRIALDVAVQAVGSGGLLVVPQEAWEGLDPSNRQAIADQVRAAKVVILTAECSDDSSLTAESV